MPIKLSVIIVSYNSEDFIEKCLTSLRTNEMCKAISPNEKIASSKTPRNDGKGVEIIVIDNASTDGTVNRVKHLSFDFAQDKESRVKLIENKENSGFAKANNLAAREATGEYLFFLNPDTEIPKAFNFHELINFYEKTPDCGIVAPKLVMADGKTQASVRKLPTVLGAFEEYILGIKNAYSEYVPEGENPQEVEMIYGAAMLIKKDLFEKLGGFDEKYFLYYEDANLCKRIIEAGKKIYYYPGVFVRHKVGGTKSSKDTYRINYESSIKYHGILGVRLLQLIFFISRLRTML